jgi:hypothetical protein
MLERGGLVRAGAQPYLGARTVESGDKMIDGVLILGAFAVARSLEAVQPIGAGGRLHSGADRKHLRDEGQARRMR